MVRSTDHEAKTIAGSCRSTNNNGVGQVVEESIKNPVKLIYLLYPVAIIPQHKCDHSNHIPVSVFHVCMYALSS